MTEPEKNPTPGEQPAEEATLEETRAKEEQDSNSILSRLVSRTKPIGFFGPILVILLFPLFLSLGSAASPVARVFLGAVFALLFIALPIFLLVGLSQSQGERPMTEPQEESELEESELEESELEEPELEEPELEETTLEETTLEEATLEETRAKEEREFDDILRRLVYRTGQISFYGSIFLLFGLPLFFFGPGDAESSASSRIIGIVICLLFLAIPLSAIVGLFSCLLLWGAPTTKADLKIGIVFSALADVFALGFSVIMPFGLRLFK
ncbi:MAG: hypothetical protein IJL92_06930 [Thermoguttaceae bacterium]|nr:hypothetical protein [Thermoguttaceae bacterium]